MFNNNIITYRKDLKSLYYGFRFSNKSVGRRQANPF
ncbi:hypothetical protein [Klebsiella phage vB_KpnM-VAC36]|nr:hypothetical protein [Klebsiella phage vB_KpnM-VAC36]WLJ69953.1 hypothetical protein BM7_CDS0024 [Klebsiella phage Kpn BM7]